MPAFTAPGILFLNTWDAPERSFCRKVFGALRERGYTRYVEPAAGAFTMPLVALQAGWLPTQMEASDVSLYSSIVGCLLSGTDLATLQVAIDGDVLELPDAAPTDQAAYLLWRQILARTEARPKVEYWLNMITDLQDYADQHQAHIATRLVGMVDRLAGVQYRPMDLWDHIAEVWDDPHTLINANPPTFHKGFERFFDTDGRLTWAEPKYSPWDPVPDTQRLHEVMKDKAAMLLYLQQKAPGQWTDTPVFGRFLSPGQVVYLNSNRPDEVFEITGGPKVAPKRSGEISPYERPMLPFDYDVNVNSRIELLPVKAPVMDYYRNLWVHRLNATPGSNNLLVLVDGHVAGGIGYGTESMVRPYAPGTKWEQHLILRFAFGSPHESLRMGRLSTMLALNRGVAEVALTGQAALYLAASNGLVTVEMTRHPEIKGLRGLMALSHRDKHPDGFKLVYSASWRAGTIAQELREFVAKESKWQAQRRRQQQPDTTSPSNAGRLAKISG